MAYKEWLEVNTVG